MICFIKGQNKTKQDLFLVPVSFNHSRVTENGQHCKLTPESVTLA